MIIYDNYVCKLAVASYIQNFSGAEFCLSQSLYNVSENDCTLSVSILLITDGELEETVLVTLQQESLSAIGITMFFYHTNVVKVASY